MELWVRSQDKETLIKSYELYIRPYSNIYAIRAKKTSNIMGLYKSKERALEVLSKIQERIINLQLVNLEEKGKAKRDVFLTPYLECVYQMPEE